MTRLPARLIPIAAVALTATLALAGARASVKIPAETTAGTFAGTWYRVEPGTKQMLQVRPAAGGGWDLRFVWDIAERGLRIDTGWVNRAEFSFRGAPGTFELTPRREASSAHRIVCSSRRDQESPSKAHLIEEGEVALFRAGAGRALVWLQDVSMSVSVPDPIAPYEADAKRTEQRVWIFMKAAKRLLEWDEIPW